MKPTWVILCWSTVLLVAGNGPALAQDAGAAKPAKLQVLAHYMPWFEAKPFSPNWGWHWTMNHFDPEKFVKGNRSIASHLSPLIGPYDSGDPKVLEYHLLLMKLAGIDGVIIDWYGLQDFRDYKQLHRNTERLVEQVKRLGMKFAICYEDQTIPALVDAERLKAAGRVDHAVGEIEWMIKNWFSLDSYARVEGRPLLLSFGQTGLTDAEWSTCMKRVGSALSYLSLHHRRTSALGAFDWPTPSAGVAATERFQTSSRAWTVAIPVVFPRFVDIYAEARVHPSYGRIEDDGGRVFKTTLAGALAMKPGLIQVATWNDWGEGTAIEPSHEYGYRDLEVLQETRRHLTGPPFKPTADDLRLPGALLSLRRSATDPKATVRLDQIAQMISLGKTEEARAALRAMAPR